MTESIEGSQHTGDEGGAQGDKAPAEERQKEPASRSCSPGEGTHLPTAPSSDSDSRPSPLWLTPEEQHVISGLSSLDFGFAVVQETEEGGCNGDTEFQGTAVQRSLLLKAVAAWTRVVANDPSLDCQLGHVFLLLEKFDKAKLHYERFGTRYGNILSDVSYLYGLGLVYFHFDHLHREKAADCFRRALSISPSFLRANEAVLRLAILAHKQGDYEQALRDFTSVYEDPRACSLTRPEVLVYIGHLQAILKRPVEAVDIFNQILATPSWLYHTCPALDAVCPMRSVKALEMLNSAVGACPSCWHAWFLLGRYHEAQGRVQEAFMALRHAISKDSSRPEVWCAIGKLYHQQVQANDAVQAYLSAIYIDPAHTLSWCNLAILYQSVDQAIDALVCYENAQRNAAKTDPLLATVDSKIEALRYTVSTNYQQLCAQARFIPALVEAWPKLVAPLVRQQQKEPQLPIMSPTNLQVASPAPPPSPAFGSLPGRERDKHKSQEPIIISRGFPQPALCSPTYPPNQVAPSATPMCRQQDMWIRPLAPPLSHPTATQWDHPFPGAPTAYQNSRAPPPQGNPSALPTFDHHSMDPSSSAVSTASFDVQHTLLPDPTPYLLPAIKPLPHLSRDDVLNVLTNLPPSSNQGTPPDHTDALLTLTHQDCLMFDDLAPHPTPSHSTFNSSTSLPAALHHEAGVIDGCHGYSRSLQPSPNPANQSVFGSRKRGGALCSPTECKRMYQGSDTYGTSSGPAPTQTVGFSSYMKDVCSVGSQYRGAQVVALSDGFANHCVGYPHQGGLLTPHQSAACVDSKLAFLSSLCDLASDQHVTSSPPHFPTNQTPLLHIGHDHQRFM